MKILKKIINIIVILLFITCVFLFIYSLINKIFGLYDTNYIFKTKKYSWIIVTDTMMEPIISKNDIVIFKKCSEEDLKKEDIIYFEESNSKKIGRIKNIKTDKNGNISYITKGEKNYYYNPEEITIRNVEGKYVKTISKIGTIFLIVTSDMFSIFVIIIISFMLIASIRNQAKSKERIKKRRKQKRKI